MISRFGKFYVKDKSERRGRNPWTRGDMMFGSRRVVIFRCSTVLREKITGRVRDEESIDKKGGKNETNNKRPASCKEGSSKIK